MIASVVHLYNASSYLGLVLGTLGGGVVLRRYVPVLPAALASALGYAMGLVLSFIFHYLRIDSFVINEMYRLREFLRGTYDQEALFYGVTIALYAIELLAPFYYSLRHLSNHTTAKGYRHFWIIPACIGSLFLFDAIARDRLPGDNTFTYLALPAIHWLVGLYFFLLQHNGAGAHEK